MTWLRNLWKMTVLPPESKRRTNFIFPSQLLSFTLMLRKYYSQLFCQQILCSLCCFINFFSGGDPVRKITKNSRLLIAFVKLKFFQLLVANLIRNCLIRICSKMLEKHLNQRIKWSIFSNQSTKVKTFLGGNKNNCLKI